MGGYVSPFLSTNREESTKGMFIKRTKRTTNFSPSVDQVVAGELAADASRPVKIWPVCVGRGSDLICAGVLRVPHPRDHSPGAGSPALPR